MTPALQAHLLAYTCIWFQQTCQKLRRNIRTLLENSYIVVTEDYSQSNQSQIDFSFPDFETQFFDVGKYGVVEARRLFQEAGIYSFTDGDWDGALNSKVII